MSSNTYTILPDQPQEDALHSTRLLQVEERPFQRVTRNLLGKDSLLKWTPPRQLPSPPPDEPQPEEAEEEEAVQRRQKFREDILLDFAALESSILRIQLIQSSNARERERYAAEKATILETAQGVRDNTLALRAQLVEAQRVLELRKGYDELAAKLIDGGQKLKPREETKQDLRVLEKEIEDLEVEGRDFEGLWVGRRDAFDKVTAEGRNLVRVVKGIKDEPEPEAEKEDEVMEDGEKEERSRMGTPAAIDGATPRPREGTPLLPGGETPVAVNKLLEVEDAGTRGSSRVGTPMVSQGDVEMAGEEQKATEEIGAEVAENGAIAQAEGVEEQIAMLAEVMDES